jgi:hypothetical protein
MRLMSPEITVIRASQLKQWSIFCISEAENKAGEIGNDVAEPDNN